MTVIDGIGREDVRLGPYLAPTEADAKAWAPFALFMMIESFLEAGRGRQARAVRAKLPPPPVPPEGYTEREARMVGALFCNRFELDGRPFCRAGFFEEGDGGVRLEVERPSEMPWGEFMALIVFRYLDAVTDGDLILGDTDENRELGILNTRLLIDLRPGERSLCR